MSEIDDALTADLTTRTNVAPGPTSPVLEQDGKAEKKSAATLLVELAEQRFTFGLSDLDEPFAVPVTGPEIVRTLRGGRTSLRAVLAGAFYDTFGKAAPQQALADALLVLEGRAFQGAQTPLHLRVAEHDGAWWLDLGDETGQAVKITAAGWVVTDRVPVRFKRTSLQSALPTPTTGGSLDLMWQRLNIVEDDRPLILAWLVAALLPNMPHPVLSLLAEQGTGKSTTTKVVVSLLDPSPVPLRKPPKDMDSWVTAAQGSWVVGLDNLSGLPDWLSDSLCRAVTGDGDVRRRLYTDGDYAVFAFRRCIVANGIDLGGIRGDLADRMLPITLSVIGPAERRPESELWARWTEDHPQILGALLDLAAGVAGVLPSVSLGSVPRMADFARVVAAVDRVLGTEGLARYTGRAAELAADQLSGELFYAEMIRCIPQSSWSGTAAELLELVTPTNPEWRQPRSGWPKDPRAVTGLLRRIAPTMRKVGWTVTDTGRGGHDKVTHFHLIPPDPAGDTNETDEQESSRETSPQRPQRPQNPVIAGDAGDNGTNRGNSLGLPDARDARSRPCGHPGDPATKCGTCAAERANREAAERTSGSPTTECRYCGTSPAESDGYCDTADQEHVTARRYDGRPRAGESR